MNHLSLVPDRVDQLGEPSALGPAVGVPRPRQSGMVRVHAGRPWDELEPLWLPPAQSARRLLGEASSVGVEAGIAVSVVLERAMACAELHRLGRAEVIPRLDRHAAGARPRRRLGGAASAYLRQLAGGRRARATAVDGPIQIPGRVTARLADIDRDDLVRMLDGDMGLAIRWERAALLAGWTLTEWAALEAVGLLAAEG